MLSHKDSYLVVTTILLVEAAVGFTKAELLALVV